MDAFKLNRLKSFVAIPVSPVLFPRMRLIVIFSC